VNGTFRCATDYPVGHRAVYTERAATRRSWAVAPDCLGNVWIQLSIAIDNNDRLMWLGHQIVNNGCPVCTGLSGAPNDRRSIFLSNGYNCGGGYKYPTNQLFEGVGAQATYQDIL
jgi:hypothetical protein